MMFCFCKGSLKRKCVTFSYCNDLKDCKKKRKQQKKNKNLQDVPFNGVENVPLCMSFILNHVNHGTVSTV